MLHFDSKELTQRWQQICDAGASWDYSEYQPHVTISYNATNVGDIEPYTGQLVFGPERFAEIKEDWADDIIERSSDHPGGTDLHIKPQNAAPVYNIPVADAVTAANVQHVSWEMVRERRAGTVRRWVMLADLIATQRVIDRKRVAKHERKLRETGQTEPGQAPPLVLLWDDDLFILGGHHGLQAARNLGVKEVEVDLMVAPK
jgi:hypothetical protein